jgi:hypothetical protein
MGNYIFRVDNPPQRGSICVIVDSKFTQDQKYPANIYGQGAKVKVIGSKNLLCSRQNAPIITASLVQFEDGRKDVYLTNNLRPIG